ncbi:hypothetical protein V6N12_023887 [Hibiscus sabdariffa]|uniref:Uncharacterized protein n=1 Tax=Hibiscus sabdariffa TaxID=183260 RepID=A0ABR2FZ74_9ROSI
MAVMERLSSCIIGSTIKPYNVEKLIECMEVFNLSVVSSIPPRADIGDGVVDFLMAFGVQEVVCRVDRPNITLQNRCVSVQNPFTNFEDVVYPYLSIPLEILRSDPMVMFWKGSDVGGAQTFVFSRVSKEESVNQTMNSIYARPALDIHDLEEESTQLNMFPEISSGVWSSAAEGHSGPLILPLLYTHRWWLDDCTFASPPDVSDFISDVTVSWNGLSAFFFHRPYPVVAPERHVTEDFGLLARAWIGFSR